MDILNMNVCMDMHHGKHVKLLGGLDTALEYRMLEWPSQ